MIPYRHRIIRAILLILALAVVICVYRIIVAEEDNQIDLIPNEYFVRSSVPYYPEVYVLGVEVEPAKKEPRGTIIDSLIKCESGGNPYAYNKDDPNGGSKGILQYQEPTFQMFCVEKYGLENDIWNPEIQIRCAKKMLNENLHNHWSCWKMIDN